MRPWTYSILKTEGDGSRHRLRAPSGTPARGAPWRWSGERRRALEPQVRLSWTLPGDACTLELDLRVCTRREHHVRIPEPRDPGRQRGVARELAAAGHPCENRGRQGRIAPQRCPNARCLERTTLPPPRERAHGSPPPVQRRCVESCGGRGGSPVPAPGVVDKPHKAAPNPLSCRCPEWMGAHRGRPGSKWGWWHRTQRAPQALRRTYRYHAAPEGRCQHAPRGRCLQGARAHQPLASSQAEKPTGTDMIQGAMS